jgi:hypothetical protein
LVFIGSHRGLLDLKHKKNKHPGTAISKYIEIVHSKRSNALNGPDGSTPLVSQRLKSKQKEALEASRSVHDAQSVASKLIKKDR